MKSIVISLKKNYKGIIIMIMASFLTALGQLFWKIFQESNDIFYLLGGFLFYGIGAILMIISFKFGKYSIIHPTMCTAYIFAIILGNLILKEEISLYKSLGIALVMIGVVCIGGGDE